MRFTFCPTETIFNNTVVMFKIEISWRTLYSKLIHTIIGPILPTSLAILLKIGRFNEIWPFSRPPIFLGYSFELCGLEIGHLAAVEEDPNHSLDRKKPEPVFLNLLRSAGIDSQPGGPGQQPYMSYRPTMLHRLVESNPRNRFLVSLNFYKYWL